MAWRSKGIVAALGLGAALWLAVVWMGEDEPPQRTPQAAVSTPERKRIPRRHPSRQAADDTARPRASGPVTPRSVQAWADALSQQERAKILDFDRRLAAAKRRDAAEQPARPAEDPFDDPKVTPEALLAHIDARLAATITGERRARVIEIARKLLTSELTLRKAVQEGSADDDMQRAHEALVSKLEGELKSLLNAEEYAQLAAADVDERDLTHHKTHR